MYKQENAMYKARVEAGETPQVLEILKLKRDLQVVRATDNAPEMRHR